MFPGKSFKISEIIGKIWPKTKCEHSRIVSNLTIKKGVLKNMFDLAVKLIEIYIK